MARREPAFVVLVFGAVFGTERATALGIFSLRPCARRVRIGGTHCHAQQI